MTVKIITPYVFENEITQHQQLFWEYDVYERDVAGIGSDLMFQKIWNQYPQDDIFILHADMTPHHDGWFEEVLEYVEQYPEAGMFGFVCYCTLQRAKVANISYSRRKIHRRQTRSLQWVGS